MNQVMIIGNLTRDPELRYSTGANQTAICRFTVAVNEGYGDKKRTDYPSIVTFGKVAENCEKYLSKGSKVAIEGRLQTGSYEKDGRKIYTTDVIASKVEFLKTETVTEVENESQIPPVADEDVPQFSAMKDDDIPF